MIQRNFATYRKEVKSLNPSISEQDVYSMFIKDVIGEWHVQSTPIAGVDGKYHKLYISVRNDDQIYVGKHTSSYPSDEYVGSGVEVSDSQKSGYTFKRHTLEYFRDDRSAFAGEKFIVNERFVKTPGVLNHAVGGDMNRYEQTNEANGSVSVSTRITKPHPIKKKAWSFGELKQKRGDILKLVSDSKITCTVINNWYVTYNGRTTSLGKLTNEVSSEKYGNPLYAWVASNGKLLSQIRDEIISLDYAKSTTH